MKKTILFITALILTLCFAVGTASADSVTLSAEEKAYFSDFESEVNFIGKEYYAPLHLAFLERQSIEQLLSSDRISDPVYFFFTYDDEIPAIVMGYQIVNNELSYSFSKGADASVAPERFFTENYRKYADILLKGSAKEIKNIYFIDGLSYCDPCAILYETDCGDFVSLYFGPDAEENCLVPIETLYDVYAKEYEEAKLYDGTVETAFYGDGLSEGSISVLSAANITGNDNPSVETFSPTALVIILAAVAVLLVSGAVIIIVKRKKA